MYILLDNIRSAHNVGAILRTADALGNTTVVLSGYTPRLKDKYGLPNNKVLKVSLGAEDQLPILNYESAEAFLADFANLQNKQFAKSSNLSSLTKVNLLSLELHKSAINYTDYRFSKRQTLDNTVLVVGNEVTGVAGDLLELSDSILEIPMAGNKESLNVAISLAVVGFYLRDNL